MGKPEIRFKGYTDEWEQRKLPEFVTFFNGLTYTPNDVEETGTLILRSSNVKNGEIVDADNVYVNDKVVTSENVQEGDIIVVVRNGSRALIGKHAQIKASMPNTVIGAFMSGMRSEHSSFVNALLDTSAFENEIAKNMGATINQITGYMFSKMEFMIPSGEEQQKIGEYFQSFDHLITLHQRKCDEVKSLKKYMLQKMFPQNEQKVPEIRFEGFTEAWEQRKVSEIAIEKLSNGIMNNQSDDETGVKHINVINMYDTDKIHPEKLTFSNYDEEAVKKCNVEFGDIFLTRSSLKPEGIAEANVLLDSGRFVYDDHLIRLKVNKEKYDPFFVKLNLSGNAFKRQFIVRAKTTAFTTIGQEDISECLGFFPKKEEQQQIGEYFMVLNNLITLHQQKCEELKKIKKFMLQKMFV